MRALRFDRYGPPDVLRVDELPEPVPRAGEARVRVVAVSLNPLDWKTRAGHLRYFPMAKGPPRGLGCDYAGRIVAIGGGATERHLGERVMGSLVPFARDGALAEFIVAPYDRLVAIPDGIDDAVAASLPIAAGTALQAIVDEGQMVAGQRALVTGAAGGVGHFAVQVAKHAGAVVVAVCGARNLDFVRGLGADEVIDYAREDFTLRDDRFDVVFDAACASSFDAAKRVLGEAGLYINTGGTATAVARTAAGALIARLTSRQRAIPIVLDNRPPRWKRLLRLVQSGVLVPRIERTIALEEVAAAQRDMETGHGRGKIVVKLD
jgi:NADPH:quinone reductase-like Zn-dependent oxidoreductase